MVLYHGFFCDLLLYLTYGENLLMQRSHLLNGCLCFVNHDAALLGVDRSNIVPSLDLKNVFHTLFLQAVEIKTIQKYIKRSYPMSLRLL